jgi:sRNA-binding regulator protein Hfq
MEYLAGLKEYLNLNYDDFALEKAYAQSTWHIFHLHGRRVLPARIIDSQTYSATLEDEQGNHLTVHKTAIKFFHSLEEALEIVERIKFDRQVRSRKLLPIISARDRHFIKNKSLYPLMLEREVLFFTLLEGEILRGVVQGFNRFEIRVNLKGGLPVTIMRHALYEVQDKKGRSFLKPVQDKKKEWKKSQYYVTAQE